MKHLSIIFLLLLQITLQSQAADTFKGNLTSDTTWSGDTIIVDTFSIDSGISLIISDSTRVEFKHHLEISKDASLTIGKHSYVRFYGDVLIDTNSTLTVYEGTNLYISGPFDEQSINSSGQILLLGKANDSITLSGLTDFEGFNLKTIPEDEDSSKFQYCSFKGGNTYSFSAMINLFDFNKVEISNCSFTDLKMHPLRFIRAGAKFSNILFSNSDGKIFDIRRSNVEFDSLIVTNFDPTDYGPIRLENCTASINNSTFEGINFSSASSDGGGVSCINSDVTIKNSIFGNGAINGAGIRGGLVHACTSNVKIDSCYFYNYEVDGIGKTGAIYCDTSTLEVTNTNFFKIDVQEGRAGAITAINSTVKIRNINVDSSLTKCIAIYLNKCKADIEHCKITNSYHTGGAGGLIQFDESEGSLTNSEISSSQNKSYDEIGLMLINSSSPKITNCTFAGSKNHQYGNDEDCSGIIITGASTPIFKNCIIADIETYGIRYFSYIADSIATPPVFENCLINGETENVLNQNLVKECKLVNTILDPAQFTDSTTGDYSLRKSSPAINTGLADTTGLGIGTVDLAGNPRIYDGSIKIIDMGAYEFQNEGTGLSVSSLKVESIKLNKNGDNILFSLNNTEKISTKLSLFTINGRLIDEFNIGPDVKNVKINSFKKLSKGFYLIKFVQNDRLIKTYKISIE